MTGSMQMVKPGEGARTALLAQAGSEDDFLVLDKYSETGVASVPATPRMHALATVSAGFKNDKGGPARTDDGTIYIHDNDGSAPGLRAMLERNEGRYLTVAFPSDNFRDFIQQRFAEYSASALKAYGDSRGITVLSAGGRQYFSAGTPEFQAAMRRCTVTTSIYFTLAEWVEGGATMVFDDGYGFYRLRFTSRNSLDSILASLRNTRQVTGGRIAGLPFDLFLRPEEVVEPGGARRKHWIWQCVTRPPQGMRLTPEAFRLAMSSSRAHLEQISLGTPEPETYEMAALEAPALEAGSLEAPALEAPAAIESEVVPGSWIEEGEIEQPISDQPSGDQPALVPDPAPSGQAMTPEQRERIYALAKTRYSPQTYIKEMGARLIKPFDQYSVPEAQALIATLEGEMENLRNNGFGAHSSAAHARGLAQDYKPAGAHDLRSAAPPAAPPASQPSLQPHSQAAPPAAEKFSGEGGDKRLSRLFAIIGEKGLPKDPREIRLAALNEFLAQNNYTPVESFSDLLPEQITAFAMAVQLDKVWWKADGEIYVNSNGAMRGNVLGQASEAETSGAGASNAEQGGAN